MIFLHWYGSFHLTESKDNIIIFRYESEMECVCSLDLGRCVFYIQTTVIFSRRLKSTLRKPWSTIHCFAHYSLLKLRFFLPKHMWPYPILVILFALVSCSNGPLNYWVQIFLLWMCMMKVIHIHWIFTFLFGTLFRNSKHWRHTKVASKWSYSLQMN
jgi:hypothetical protein